jgi:serine/threonine protein kinase
MKLDRTIIDPQPAERTAVDQIKLGAGLRIEQYELIRELGRGGMGQVFLARDTRLGRRVAMKFLVSGSKKLTQRFLVEARATAQCSHENIVVIHDVDEYLGMPYMVLEYVEGTSLARMIADKRMPAARAVELIVPVVKALARAHGANIIHRDLKPENIIVTGAGMVKVLDFGVATLFDASTKEQGGATGFAGTLPYMSPEQLGTDEVDARSDLWAIGILLYEMLAGKHPLEPVTQARLVGVAAAVDEPMPSLAGEVPGLPDKLVEIVARCLAKKKAERFATADALGAELETLLPSRAGRSLGGDESPYPGLTAFQESDADRFFGRSQDIAAVIARLRDAPLVGVVGPSGVGKSSFVRAGVVPALKNSGEAWETLIVRPGRYPLSALASSLESLRESRDSDPMVPGEDPVFKLRSEPGTFGSRLRARARRKRCSILVFVDQHEELYTLVTDPGERAAFTACLAGAGDDASAPVRVVVAMRSDFLDRAAENRRFVEELTRGLVFLQPPSRAGLEQALVHPVEMVGYSFEPQVVPAMLDTLAAASGSLPLLQFTAAKLWETRDRQRRVLTRESYFAMGGVAGALATHADEVLAGLSERDQKTARAILQRLVTAERTRAIVETRELREIGPDVDRIVGHLVTARLLVVQTRGEGAGAVELVHESLIKSWPTLQRWLDENQEDVAYVGQIRAAAKQWDAKGRPAGLLWTGEAMEEARLWRSRYQGELPDREHAYLDAVIELGTRATRRRRRLVVSAFVFLIALVAAAGAGLVIIFNAQQVAKEKAALAEQAEKAATDAKRTAEDKQLEAEMANKRLADQIEVIENQLATIKAQDQTIVSQTKQVADKQKLADAERERAAKAEAARVKAAESARKAAENAKKAAAAEEDRKKRNAAGFTTGLK